MRRRSRPWKATLLAKFGSDTFVVIEKWALKAALQAPAVAPHLESFAAKTKHWTVERAIQVLESAGRGGGQYSFGADTFPTAAVRPVVGWTAGPGSAELIVLTRSRHGSLNCHFA